MFSKPQSIGYTRTYHGRNVKDLIHNDRWIKQPFFQRTLANVVQGEEAMVEDR